MNTPRTLMLALAAAMTFPTLVSAADDVPAAPAASTEQIMPMPMAGMGMGYGPMHGEHCRMKKAGMLSDGSPCMAGPRQGCRTGGSAAMTDQRLDALEKRIDMMQMMMEMMLRQSAGGGQ